MIRRLNKNEYSRAAALSLEIFIECGKGDFDAEGLETFKSFIYNKTLMEELTLYGAFYQDRLAGVLGTKKAGSHISLFFVRKEYQGQGIGKELFKFAYQEQFITEITVSSSTYAVPFYEKLGFKKTGDTQTSHGLKSIPMKRSLSIRPVTENKKRFLDLLLLADEQESMVDRYLERGEMFVLYHDQAPVAQCIITDEGNGIYELKSLAVYPACQRQGYGRLLVRYIITRYRNQCHALQVGTGDTPFILSFYKRCGFTYSHRIPRFFTDHYDHPIIEEGKQLVDMVYLKYPGLA